MIIDSKPLYKRIFQLVREIDPEVTSKVILHKSKVPIFDEYYNIEDQIQKVLKSKVWLSDKDTQQPRLTELTDCFDYKHNYYE